MKIGLIKSTESVEPTGGVKVQGLMWKEGLENLGHEVVLVDFWQNYDWDSFDWIIIFEFGGQFRTMTNLMRKVSKKLACAPIIDPRWNHCKYKFFTKYWGFQKHFGLSSRFHDLFLNRNLFDLWLVRSEFEASYVEKCLDIDRSKIRIVPLQVRVPFVDEVGPKEGFCFHVSRLAAANKNVSRQIQAAIKYGYKLVLAGVLNGEDEYKWLHDMIDGHDNITYLGKLSEQELLSYYRKCKVFSLPSITEGVGMVALEAAANGAEIILTNDGAPKDYFKGRAELVTPTSVDEIGQAVQRLLKDGKSQPELLDFMKKNYSDLTCSKLLEKALEDFNQ